MLNSDPAPLLRESPATHGQRAYERKGNEWGGRMREKTVLETIGGKKDKNNKQ